MIKYKINEKYKDSFTDFILNIKDYFKNNEQTIHKARNELKIINHNGIDTVVKAFRIPNIINQFAYAYIRDGKAKKSFENSMKLIELGVNTPEPIGYIEFYSNGLLKESFFISEEFKYDFTMAHIRDDQPSYKSEVLEEFAKFTFDIHQKRVWHSDYSGGNVLVKEQDNKYEFSLVDINRMKFMDIQNYDGLENFNKFWFNEKDLTIIAKSYSKVAKLDEDKAIKEIIFHDNKLKEFVENRRKWKKKILGK